MRLQQLKETIERHTGQFHCVGISDDTIHKVVDFHHLCEKPIANHDIPNVGKLKEFYGTFGSLTLYNDKKSGDSAVYIAKPTQWEALDNEFTAWLEGFDEDEELLPNWVENCITIGEVPSSGNYFLMPMEGEKAGRIFEFEHDGFEFIEHAPDIETFIEGYLRLNSDKLRGMASHMRFVEGDHLIQWWIDEMTDSFGARVLTTD